MTRIYPQKPHNWLLVIGSNLSEMPSGCWEWGKHRDRRGYGRVWFRGKLWSAHRLSLYLSRAELPKDWESLESCHRCDNPPCCNPEHLFWGTSQDNMHDAWEKGRFPSRQGAANHQAKLTPSDVLEIRRLMDGKLESRSSIAARYQMAPWHISRIAKRDIWKSLPG